MRRPTPPAGGRLSRWLRRYSPTPVHGQAPVETASRARLDEHTWYHDFTPLGQPTPQAEGHFRLNQMAKQDLLFAYIERALQMCPGSGARGVELFCADGFYSHYALQAGAAHMTGLDLGDPQSAGQPFHLDQARLMTTLLGHEGRATFLHADVFDVQGSFDFAVCAGGLYHLEDPAALLRLLRDHVTHALVLQTVYTLATDDPAYFESPAPGWTWGCRFSTGWLLNALADCGWEVLDYEENVLEGNSRPEDRGSISALCRPAQG